MVNKTKISNYDTGWQLVIEEYLPLFLEFFYPELNKNIDYTKKYVFLDKELHQILLESKTGKRYVDKLVQVYYKNGEPKWLLLHIEVQQKKEKYFAKRMYIYNYKIFDFRKKDTISLAILGDNNKNNFIDWLFYLPDDLELKFTTEIKKIKEVINVPVILAAERVGILKGIEQGIEKGKKEGKLEGKKEGKFEVAKRMLKEGFDMAIISKLTGLPKKELKLCK